MSFCVCKTTWWAPELPVSMCPSSHLWFLYAKQRILDQNYKSPWVPDLFCGFCMQNIDFWTSIQVSMGTRHNLSFCACKTAWLAPELLVSLGTSPHMWFCAFKPATLGPKLHASMGLRPHLSFCASNTAWLASESLVSMVPSPYVWFLDAKQRVLNWNKKSEWVPGITHHFALANQRDLHQNDMSIWVPALICGSFHAKQWL